MNQPGNIKRRYLMYCARRVSGVTFINGYCYC